MTAAVSSSTFASNLVHFGRALREAGLPVGTGRILGSVRATATAGFMRRDDFYWVLHACLVSRAEHRPVFDRAFAMFWRDPEALEDALALMGAGLRVPPAEESPPAGSARTAAAILGEAEAALEAEGTEIEVDASLTWSAEEILRTKDFEQMTAEEERRARRMVASLRLPAPPVVSRRLHPSPRGRVPDWRAAMRAMAAGKTGRPRYRARSKRGPDLVALCDVSGSMGGYSRMLLHFLHAVSNSGRRDWGRVHSFVFGTRLTNITRYLRARDVDEALARVGAEVPDWEGGTRIGDALREFNRDWSRRVLGQGGVVLLLTDGLDRGDSRQLAAEAERLRLASRCLVWLNPLLRWEAFAPKARGVAALLPQVDRFCSAHSIQSLEELGAAFAGALAGGERERMLGLLREEHDASRAAPV